MDHPLPAPPASAGAPPTHASAALSPAEAAALRARAAAAQVPPRTAIAAAWALLAARYGGADAAIVALDDGGGDPGGWGTAETRWTRIAVDGGAGVDAWLAGVASALEGDDEAQPATTAADALSLDGARLDLAGLDAAGDVDGGRDAVDEVPHPPTSVAPLRVAVRSHGEGIALALSAAPSRLTSGQAARVIANLRAALVSLATSPADGVVGDVACVSDSERAELLGDLAGSPSGGAVPHGIHALIERWAAETPDAVAVVHDGARLTYGEMNRRANRLARRLRAMGVRPEVRVALCMRRTPELPVAILATWKAGGAYVPVDPAYPAERIAYMLADSAAPVVLTHGDVVPGLPASPAAVLAVDAPGVLDGGEDGDLAPASDPANAAYLIYTSGSTGRPKGTAIEHRSTLALLRSWTALFPGEDLGCVLGATSVSFDVHVADLVAPLAHGGTVLLVENALSLASVAADAGVRMAAMVPSAAAELLRMGGIPASLRTLVLGGEALPAALADALHAAGVPRVLNGYGPTEDTTYSTIAEVPAGAARVSIGRTVPGSRAYVLDGRLRPVPRGAPGELWLAGDGLARGYAGRPGLTAERWLPCPFDAPGARMYRVGDLVRWRDDGALEYLGRTDHQVKVRGFRVEPGEIEAALRAVPGVGAALVTASPGPGGAARLAAYWTPAAGAAAPSTAALRSALRAALPEHMVPSAFVRLEAFPLSPNGKTDRAALPAPDFAADAAPYEAPRSGTERALAAIWREVLALPRVGRADSFLELGGHSLLATQVVSRVRTALGAELPLRIAFDAPTLAAMAAAVDARLAAAEAGGETEREAPVVRVPLPLLADRVDEMAAHEVDELLADLGAAADGPLAARRDRARAALAARGEVRCAPVSTAQQRLWFIDRMGPGGAAYVIPQVYRFTGALDVAALGRAVDEVVRRHAQLRVTFRTVAGDPVQVVSPPSPSILSIEEVGDSDQALRREREEAATPFDLRRGPLFRARLLRVADEEHVLLATMHHAVSDGWSVGVLARELAALYRAFAAGEPSPLPPIEAEYTDVAAWQAAHVAGAVAERETAYWRARLAGAPDALELPTDRPRPPLPSGRGAVLPVRLDAGLTASLHALARAEGASLFMVLMAGVQAVLGRWARQDDLVVGSPIAGRTRAESEPLIGFFTNTLALRGDLSGAPTFRALVARVRETTLGAYAHQELPFEAVVDALGLPRDTARNPLFQAIFVLQNAPAPAFAVPGLSVEERRADVQAARVDLTLSLEEAHGAVGGYLEYATDLWDGATAARLAGSLVRLLAAAAAAPDARVDDLPLLAPAEAEAELAAAVGPPAPRVEEAGIHALVERWAAATPDAPAVRWRDTTLTHGELNARANRLAHHLRRRGVRAETRVGVCLERTPDLLVSLLAVLKAGGAYVPLDPAYPAERIAGMVEDSGAPLVVTDGALAARLGLAAETVLRLDVEAAAVAAEPSHDPAPMSVAENAAYLIYTSGSTGRPKGVAIEHRATLALLHDLAGRFTAEETACVLGSTSVSFDVSIADHLFPLSRGGCVVLADNALSLAEMRDAGARMACMVPGAAAELLRMGALPGALRTLVLAGEALPADLARALYDAGLPRLVNAYGPTEDTTYSTVWEVPRGVARMSLGAPVAGSRAYVLDGRMRPVPPGVAGELWLAGAGLARGYAGRPALTAERWMPDPYGAPGARMYRVGDVARRRTDGTLEYLGRTDHQVKVRGFRIEPGEIEAALRAHPAVREAVVVAGADAAGATRLAAYVAGDADADALRAHLRASLPAHMVPGAFVRVDALPRTPNGKVDRRALPAVDPAADDGAQGAYAAPHTPDEEVLAAVLAGVLGRERIGTHDDFFALGGHSLLAARAVSRIREALGVELSPRALFDAPTVVALAGRVAAARGEAPAPPLVAVPRDAPVPASFAQRRLWFLDQVAPGSPVYNMPFAWRLRGALDADALERALGEVVRRHEALRTVFAAADGEPVQVVVPFAGFRLPRHDLSAMGETRDDEVRRRIEEAALRPFDLAAGPLFRAELLRCGGDDHVLLLAMHHVASDGWSMGVLADEMAALYAAFARGAASPLPEPTLRYADFAAWQHALVAGVGGAQLDWWSARLAGMGDAAALATDRPRPAAPTSRGDAVAVTLPRAVADGVRRLARDAGATRFMTLLAAFDALLARWTGADDVVVGTVVAGRTRAETEGMIGFFVNTLPVRADLGGDPTVRELLGRVREAALGAYAHQDVPFERIVERVGGTGRDAAGSPLFPALFVLQEDEGGAPVLDGLDVAPLPCATGTAKFDLTVQVRDSGDEMEAAFEYASELFDRATVERLAAGYARLLAAAVADPGARLSALPLVSDDERRTIVVDRNATAAPYPRDATIPALFAGAAARRPDAVALVCGGETVTYRELDARSNRIAHRLRTLGVGPETPVGICAERSVELVAGILGIVKAGGAYVPLDPAYPAERLAWMVEDTRVPVLLAQPGLVPHLPAHGAVVVPLDDPTLEAASTLPPEVPIDPRNAAYVVYTSGSTGRPKGVPAEHRGVVRLVRGAGFAPMGEDDVYLQTAPVAFDASTFEIWAPLLNGGRLVVLPPHTPSPEEIGAAVRAHGVTTLWLTTGLFHQLVDLCPEALAPLRQVITGGDVVSPDHLRRAREAAPGVRITNGYGPTENTTFSTVHHTGPGDDDGAVPIGAPLGNSTAYVLDGAMRPVPDGVAGELFVGGDGLARGYLRRPALTAAAFVPHPFAAEPGSRLYRTGDRTRWRRDGVLEFLGRVDGQVKIRGFRIEPGEVEAAVRTHPAVREAAVVAREDAPGDRRLVAYVVGREGDVAAASLRAHLRAELPEHMVPAAFVAMDALPLNANGKVDRRALPAPAGGRDAGAAFVAPRTATEEAVAAIWREVLRVERVGVDDPFFELGGHSLMATQVMARVRRAFTVDLPLRALFEGRTVAALARRVDAARTSPAPAAPRPGPALGAAARARFRVRLEDTAPGGE